MDTADSWAYRLNMVLRLSFWEVSPSRTLSTQTKLAFHIMSAQQDNSAAGTLCALCE